MDGRRSGQRKLRLEQWDGDSSRTSMDQVAIEEPMEVRLRFGDRMTPVAVTMRTPGDDFELAAGFLFAEGVITSIDQLGQIEYCLDCEGAEQRYNIVTVATRSLEPLEQFSLRRNFSVSSSCGLCGKEQLDQIERQGMTPIASPVSVSPEVVRSLPGSLRNAQGLFASTGGLHAAALFTMEGELISIREDVGRHNAVDKLIGWALLEHQFPLSNRLLMVSGRTSFEIAQKALVAGIPVLCSVSAPSSLSVGLARRFGMTLVGFVRGDRFNVYSGKVSP